MRGIIALILGGGRGTRLYPLTKMRSKPAVPIAGKYRLIDIPISNCLHANIPRMFILTQFNSQSLNRHISRTYQFGCFVKGFCEIMAAQQTMDHAEWYQGTADAVRQNMERITRYPEDELTLVLSGDQLYRMDFLDLVRRHEECKAEITIAAKPVERSEAHRFGILKVDESRRIVRFAEKPKLDDQLDELRADDNLLLAEGIQPKGRTHLASMGIYLFETEVLNDLLSNRQETDFGREVIPRAIRERKVHAYLFDGYWEDIGTIRAFHKANLDLAADLPSFNFYDEARPVYTRPRFLPGSKIHHCLIDHSIVSDGCIVHNCEIVRSVIGIRSIVGDGTVIRNSVIMGADYYDFSGPESHRPVIGRNCLIENAIIDKNAHVGDNARIVNAERVSEAEGPNYVIRNGIVVVPKDAIIEPGTQI